MSATANVAERLARQARERPNEEAVVKQSGLDEFRTVTYRELEDETERLARGLRRMGLGPGVRTVLMVPPGPEMVALAFALLRSGAVPVLIDPGMGVRNLKGCIAQVAPEAFIGVPKAHAARALLGWGRGTIRTLVTVGTRLGWGGLTLDALRAEGIKETNTAAWPAPDESVGEPSAIFFTSGSTGPPKGTVYTHAILNAQIDSMAATFGMEPGQRDLATFPLFGLFGPALGMTTIVPDMDATRPASADPRRLLAAVERQRATSMFGSPALVNTMSRYIAERGVKLPSLARVVSAGAPANPKVLERFVAALAPEANFFTPYGATEALPVCTIGHREILGETRRATGEGKGVCVGRPVSGMTVKAIRITDEPIAEWSAGLCVGLGETGELAVKGPVVTPAYYRQDDATALAKMRDPADGKHWHRMGDVGYLDAQGRVWMCGRKSHRVVTRDGTLFTVACEGVFNAHPQVYRSALVGVGEPGAQRPVVCVELERGAGDRERIRGELLELGAAHAHTAGLREIHFHPGFPVDIRHNSKIFREKLRPWAAARVGVAP